jgi:hypothetical protein
MLQDKVAQLSTDFVWFVGEVSAQRSAAAGIQTLSQEVSALKAHIAGTLRNSVMEQLSTEFSELRREECILKA